MTKSIKNSGIYVVIINSYDQDYRLGYLRYKFSPENLCYKENRTELLLFWKCVKFGGKRSRAGRQSLFGGRSRRSCALFWGYVGVSARTRIRTRTRETALAAIAIVFNVSFRLRSRVFPICCRSFPVFVVRFLSRLFFRAASFRFWVLTLRWVCAWKS